MSVEESCVTFAFVGACYFRKLLFSPPLVEGSVWARCQQAWLCTCSGKSEPNPGGSFQPLNTLASPFFFFKFDFKQLSPAFLKVPSASKNSLQIFCGCAGMSSTTFRVGLKHPKHTWPVHHSGPCPWAIVNIMEWVFTFYEMEHLVCFYTLMHVFLSLPCLSGKVSWDSRTLLEIINWLALPVPLHPPPPEAPEGEENRCNPH